MTNALFLCCPASLTFDRPSSNLQGIQGALFQLLNFTIVAGVYEYTVICAYRGTRSRISCFASIALMATSRSTWSGFSVLWACNLSTSSCCSMV